MMPSVCFDIVVLPVFTCYVHKFNETKTNLQKLFKTHFPHADRGPANLQYFYKSVCIVQINFVSNLYRGQSVT